MAKASSDKSGKREPLSCLLFRWQERRASAARAIEATAVYGSPTLATVSHKKSLTVSGLFNMAVRGEGRVFASGARATEATAVYGRPTLATVSHKKSLTVSGLFNMAVREGFEPSRPCDLHTFQACSFDHSDTSPITFEFSTR